jgi:uncharacterized protein YbjQ (UPF0145 family)
VKPLLPHAVAAAALFAVPSMAFANQINTGAQDGAYHATFCPALETQLARSKFEFACSPSEGTVDNMSRVAAEPRQIGYGQLDVFALEAAALGGAKTFSRLRLDDARECVFAVTRNRELTSYGDVAVNAGRLRFVLPPKTSGSAGTFRFLQQIDGDGVGKAKAILNAADPDEAIKLALSADDTVAFFVQFPDPDNARFKTIEAQGGHIVPVIDRAILRQQIDGQKVYFAQETQVANAKWIKSGQKVVTACTPLVLFTGTPERVTSDKARQDHKDMIATVQALKVEALLPNQGLFSRMWKRTRELSGASVEKLVAMSQTAREKAKPMMEKAQELGAEALEKAKEAAEKARKAAEGAMESKPGEPPKPQ